MKVGMIIISNRPVNLLRLSKTLHNLGSVRNRIEIGVIIQPPFTGDESFLSEFNRVRMSNSSSPPIPFIKYRVEAMQLMSHCDWFWSLDDDHRFQNSNGRVLNKTCEQYYNEVIDRLESTIDVGAISCKGFLGGYSSGYDFTKNPKNALVATDKGGIFLKNIGINLIIEDDEKNLVGALFESLAIYNIMSRGYTLERRFNSPVQNTPPGKAKKIGGSLNDSYSDETVNSNVQKRIREKFDDPNWDHSSKKYPKKIAQMHRIKQ